MSNATHPTHPVFGPLPVAEWQAALAAPHGQATKIIRKYDPQWGRASGEKFEWTVKVERSGSSLGTATIKASSQEEANKIADALSEADIDWDDDDTGFEILSVEPTKDTR